MLTHTTAAVSRSLSLSLSLSLSATPLGPQPSRFHRLCRSPTIPLPLPSAGKPDGFFLIRESRSQGGYALAYRCGLAWATLGLRWPRRKRGFSKHRAPGVAGTPPRCSALVLASCRHNGETKHTHIVSREGGVGLTKSQQTFTTLLEFVGTYSHSNADLSCPLMVRACVLLVLGGEPHRRAVDKSSQRHHATSARPLPRL